MLRPLLIAVVVMLAVGLVSADAAHAVWSGLVIAENVPQPAAIPPELNKFEQTLKDLFGYNQFEVIGQSNKTLRTGEEDWLAYEQVFFPAMRCPRRKRCGLQFEPQALQGERCFARNGREPEPQQPVGN